MPNTIDEVLAELQTIIDESIKNNSRAGYFAALYYKVTSRVKEGIANGEFQNGPRMEKLDVLFASRYLDAYRQWKNNEPVTDSWKVAFDTTKKSSALVLQQLLLGMNAHINLDLGIATVQVVNGGDLQSIHSDFNTINTIISSLTNQVLNKIARISPLLSLLGLHATNNGSVIIQFSIDNARDGAWAFGEELAAKSEPNFTNCVKERDNTISLLGKAIVQSKGAIRITLWLIHLFEWKNPAKIIRVMHEYKKADFKKADLTQYA